MVIITIYLTMQNAEKADKEWNKRHKRTLGICFIDAAILFIKVHEKSSDENVTNLFSICSHDERRWMQI